MLNFSMSSYKYLTIVGAKDFLPLPTFNNNTYSPQSVS